MNSKLRRIVPKNNKELTFKLPETLDRFEPIAFYSFPKARMHAQEGALCQAITDGFNDMVAKQGGSIEEKVIAKVRDSDLFNNLFKENAEFIEILNFHEILSTATKGQKSDKINYEFACRILRECYGIKMTIFNDKGEQKQGQFSDSEEEPECFFEIQVYFSEKQEVYCALRRKEKTKKQKFFNETKTVKKPVIVSSEENSKKSVRSGIIKFNFGPGEDANEEDLFFSLSRKTSPPPPIAQAESNEPSLIGSQISLEEQEQLPCMKCGNEPRETPFCPKCQRKCGNCGSGNVSFLFKCDKCSCFLCKPCSDKRKRCKKCIQRLINGPENSCQKCGGSILPNSKSPFCLNCPANERKPASMKSDWFMVCSKCNQNEVSDLAERICVNCARKSSKKTKMVCCACSSDNLPEKCENCLKCFCQNCLDNGKKHSCVDTNVDQCKNCKQFGILVQCPICHKEYCMVCVNLQVFHRCASYSTPNDVKTPSKRRLKDIDPFSKPRLESTSSHLHFIQSMLSHFFHCDILCFESSAAIA